VTSPQERFVTINEQSLSRSFRASLAARDRLT
jgi:hypothetical protein